MFGLQIPVCQFTSKTLLFFSSKTHFKGVRKSLKEQKDFENASKNIYIFIFRFFWKLNVFSLEKVFEL
jgi:hypothetical protein